MSHPAPDDTNETGTSEHPDWRDPALLRESFASMDRLFPTATIARGNAPSMPYEVALIDLEPLVVSEEYGTVADVLASTETDAWLVLHGGRIVAEDYVAPMTPSTPHLLMSVSKSIIGIIVGTLTERGVLGLDQQITSYVPELASSGYAGATLRDVLDMRSGVRFSEDYLDPDADVCLLDEAVGWAPARPTSPATLKAFLSALVAENKHGGAFHYRSCETDVLGWVAEAATGRRMADLAADLLWSRLGAETDAIITLDAEGTGVFDGGICATTRDLGRFGQMLLDDGRSMIGEQIVSQGWVNEIVTGTPDLVAAFASGPEADLTPGGHYHQQFWVPAGNQVILCVGIHGQFIYIDRSAQMVAVKFSSWPLPTDPDRMGPTLAMFGAIATHLSV